MLRGYQRKLIMIRTRESGIFESAFFILKSSSCDKFKEEEMVAEANRIIEESSVAKRKRKSFELKHIFKASVISFLAGVAVLGGIWIASVLT